MSFVLTQTLRKPQCLAIAVFSYKYKKNFIMYLCSLLVEIDTAVFIPTATKTVTGAEDVGTPAYTANGSPSAVTALIVTIVLIVVGYLVFRRHFRLR